MNCVLISLVPLLLYASSSQAAVIAATNTEGQTPPSSTANQVACPSDLPRCPPCTPDQYEKPAKLKKQSSWRADFKNILESCYQAALKLCTSLTTTNGKKYTKERMQQEKRADNSFICCVPYENEPPFEKNENDDWKNEVPAIGYPLFDHRGVPVALDPLTDPNSVQVTANCCCVGRNTVKFTGCARVRVKSRINICSFNWNVPVIDP